MGIFSNLFFKKIEKEKNVELEIFAPVNGKIIPLEKVTDETFAEKLLGEGVAIEPSMTEYILSPIDGIVDITPTMHAFTVLNDDSVEILVHFGLDTVKLNGEGFKSLVNSGDRVKKGDKIVKIDYNYVKTYAPSMTTPIIILNSEKYTNIVITNETEVNAEISKIIDISNK